MCDLCTLVEEQVRTQIRAQTPVLWIDIVGQDDDGGAGMARADVAQDIGCGASVEMEIEEDAVWQGTQDAIDCALDAPRLPDHCDMIDFIDELDQPVTYRLRIFGDKHTQVGDMR